MWAHRLTAPGRLEAVDAPEPGDPGPGEVVARFEAGGICGSDLPSFLGTLDLLTGASHGHPGYPLHELVGEVVASGADDVPVGARVVGWAKGHLGLAEYFPARAGHVLVLDDDGLPSPRATVIQPLCTVLYAVRRLGDVSGARVAVIGQGSIGLLFSHALKAAGAAHVTGVDPVDRRDVASEFGVDEMVWETGSRWAAALDGERPDIVVEAVGHQAATLEDAVEAIAHGGTVLGFGVPDDTHYAFPFAAFFRKDGTLLGGVTRDRRASLAAARDYLLEHEAMLDAYITNVFPVADAQAAFELAVKPTAGRLKVVLER